MFEQLVQVESINLHLADSLIHKKILIKGTIETQSVTKIITINLLINFNKLLYGSLTRDRNDERP